MQSKKNKNKRSTILRKQLICLFLALAAGVATSVLLYQGTAYLMDEHLERTGYYERHEKKLLRSLQDYVQLHDVAATDAEALNLWGKQQGDIFYQIYNDEKLLFQYFGRDSESYREAANTNFNEWMLPKPVQFSDGTYQVVLFGAFYYEPFTFMLIVDFLGGFLVFLAVSLPGIRRQTRYITKLRDEIEILSGGDLDYHITVKGNDELTDLAENLDQMRQALKHHMEETNRLTEERQNMITQLSHDIRTPLTAMNLFADLLSREKYKDEDQREHYLGRIRENAENLTELADELFQIVSNKNCQDAEVPGDAVNNRTEAEKFVGINDDDIDVIRFLKDSAEALRVSGFTVQEDYCAPRLTVAADRKTISRILNNITSNIMRYADPTAPVCFRCWQAEKSATAEFLNSKCAPVEAEKGGSGIGLQNVHQLMEQINGRMEKEEGETQFVLRLQLPKTIE